MIFETHAHFDDKQFNDDRDDVIMECFNNNIKKIVNIGADMKSSKNSVSLANKYDFVYATVGVHPHDVKNMKKSDLDQYEETKDD